MFFLKNFRLFSIVVSHLESGLGKDTVGVTKENG